MPCALAALWAMPGAAQGVLGSSATSLEHHGDNRNANPDDDDYLLAQQRTDLAATIGDVRLGARVDGDLFLVSPSPAYASGLALERLSLEWSVGDLTWYAGDYAAQLGRGLALSVRNAPEVGIDSAIRGARVSIDTERLAATALIGLANPANLDSISHRRLEDPGDLLSGAELRLLAADGVAVAALSSLVVPAERVLPEAADWTLTTGAAVDVEDASRTCRAGLEVDVQQRSLAGVSQQGAGATAELDLRLGDSALQLEALYLAGMEVKGSRNGATGVRFDYHQPPTLERFDQEVQNNRDVVGGRGRADLALPGGALLHASGMVRVGEAASPGAVVQTHGIAGAELAKGGTSWSVSAGVRAERLGLSKLAELRDMMHLDGDTLIQLGRGFALHSFTTLQLWRAADRPWVRGSTMLSLDKRGAASIGVEAGIDSQDPSPEVRQLFLAAMTVWHVTDDVALRATAGSQRGGVKCLGGVCRQLPAFAGAQGELEVRF